MRSYFTLLRLPYQLQLGPIFGWGFVLGNGDFSTFSQFARFAWVFAAFHICGFGGLTALNSFYDRDQSPIGGLSHPPPPPTRLRLFAWLMQIGGAICLIPLEIELVAIYAAIILLALGYSHPRTRWKGRAVPSVAVVALGQGAFDFMAGALTAHVSSLSPALFLGVLGATLSVIGFYPLTQLFQIENDVRRGDWTLAATLQKYSGRGAVFSFASIFLFLGALCNALAVGIQKRTLDALILLTSGMVVVWFLRKWKHHAPDVDNDFRAIHILMRASAIVFGLYLTWRALNAA